MAPSASRVARVVPCAVDAVLVVSKLVGNAGRSHRARGRTSFRTSATLPRPSPVPVTIGLRTPSAAAGVLPGGTDFSTLGPMSTYSIDAVDVAESAGAVARPKTTSPT